MKFAIGEMTVGDILDRGLKILLARLPTFFAINLIVMVPLFLMQTITPILLFGGTADLGSAFASMGVSLFALLLTLILAPFGAAAVIYIIGQEFIERRASLGEALRVGLARFGPLLGASILVGFGVFFGALACFVPGIIFAVWWAFVTQVVVMERQGAVEALGRSKELVEGFGWRVFGILLLVGLINIVLSMVVSIPLSLFLNPYEVVKTDAGIQQHLVSVPYLIINNAASFCVSAVLQAFQASCVTLLYFDLRIRKEGYDLELAARQQAGLGDEEYDRGEREFDDEDDRDDRDDRNRGRWEDDEPDDGSIKAGPRS